MVVAVKKGEDIVVGISTIETYSGMTAGDKLHPDNVPCWKVSGEDDCFVFSDRSSLMVDALRYNSHIFRGITDYNSLVNKVVPKMKDFLGKMNYLLRDEDMNTELVIVKGNKLYDINFDFMVTEVDGWVSTDWQGNIGGAYEVSKHLSAEDIVLSAYRNGVGYDYNFFPLIMFDNRSKKQRIISG